MGYPALQNLSWVEDLSKEECCSGCTVSGRCKAWNWELMGQIHALALEQMEGQLLVDQGDHKGAMLWGEQRVDGFRCCRPIPRFIRSQKLPGGKYLLRSLAPPAATDLHKQQALQVCAAPDIDSSRAAAAAFSETKR